MKCQHYLGHNDESLGKILAVLSLGLYMLAALIFAWEWLVGRSTKPPNTAQHRPRNSITNTNSTRAH